MKTGGLFKGTNLGRKTKTQLFAGVDIGSAFTKAVILKDRKIVAFEIVTSGGNYRKAAEKAISQVLSRASISFEDVAGIVITGVGAASAPFPSRQMSDISCQAKGVNYLFPQARTVIDIGGQSSKVIKITPEGNVVDFVISEKCAAGSGRFLQIMARILGIKIEDIGPLSLKSVQPVEFSTGCAVFAESETISRIAEGAKREDILAGVHKAIAAKVVTLVNRIGLEPECVLAGGGAEDIGLVKTVSEALGVQVLVPEHPRITAALGAACIAAERKNRHE